MERLYKKIFYIELDCKIGLGLFSMTKYNSLLLPD